MLGMPSEPMLAAAVAEFALPPGWAAEPKWDGYRALLGRPGDGRVLLRSRRGTDLTAAFPEIVTAAAALPPDVVLDGELVVWEDGRLAFHRLPGRLGRRPTTVARLARAAPAHFVVFDLLREGDSTLVRRPYAERRAALERLFGARGLGPPWTLCPSTTDPRRAEEWLTWSAVGVEGVVLKDTAQRYLPGVRAWRKYRVWDTAEAVVGAVTGSLARPGTVLLGRFDPTGTLRYVGRSTPLSPRTAHELAADLAPAGTEHPWRGRQLSTRWGGPEPLPVTLVAPDLVAEVVADPSIAFEGRWRHPVRFLRVRSDMAPADTPLLDHAERDEESDEEGDQGRDAERDAERGRPEESAG